MIDYSARKRSTKVERDLDSSLNERAMYGLLRTACDPHITPAHLVNGVARYLDVRISSNILVSGQGGGLSGRMR